VKFDWVSGDVESDTQDTLRPWNGKTSGVFCGEWIPTCREQPIAPWPPRKEIAGSKFKAVDDMTKAICRKGGPEQR